MSKICLPRSSPVLPLRAARPPGRSLVLRLPLATHSVPDELLPLVAGGLPVDYPRVLTVDTK
jgi:hypothetical protein